MKRIVSLFAGLCFVFFAGGVMAQDVIKLGVPGAHSGDLASYGLPSAHAARLVVDDINSRGGILGKKVVIFQEDDQCKPEVAANVGTKLVSERVDVVMGHICSGATKAAMSIYKDAGILCMSPSATNVDLTKSGSYPNFFRTISPDDDQANLQVEFALDTLKVAKIAIIHDKGDYGKSIAESAQTLLIERGVKPVLFEGITPGAVDYSAVIQKIRRTGADAVIYGGYHPEAAKIVSGMRKKKMDTLFISDDGVRDETFIKVAGKYAEGVYATGPIDTSKSPMAVAAIEQHRKVYGEEPGAFFLNAYSATLCLLQAIEKAGAADFDAVTESLRANWFDTPLGRISFDEKGDAKGIGFAMYQVVDGQYKEMSK